MANMEYLVIHRLYECFTKRMDLIPMSMCAHHYSKTSRPYAVKPSQNLSLLTCIMSDFVSELFKQFVLKNEISEDGEIYVVVVRNDTGSYKSCW